MSTPEERLRQRAEEALQRQPDAIDSQAELRDAARRLRRVAEAYLERATDFIAATRIRIFHSLDYARAGTAPGFTLQVGHYPVLQAVMRGSGWQVTVRERTAGRVSEVYDSDAAFIADMDRLLERMTADAIALVESGEEYPVPKPQA